MPRRPGAGLEGELGRGSARPGAVGAERRDRDHHQARVVPDAAPSFGRRSPAGRRPPPGLRPRRPSFEALREVEERAGSPAGGRVTTGRLDPDDVRPGVGEQLGAVRPGDVAGAVEDGACRPASRGGVGGARWRTVACGWRSRRTPPARAPRTTCGARTARRPLADPLHHAQVLGGDPVRVTGGHGSGQHRQADGARWDRVGDQREEVARDQARHGPDHDVDVVRSGAVDDGSMEREGEPGEVLGLGGGGQLGDDLRQSLDQCAIPPSVAAPAWRRTRTSP